MHAPPPPSPWGKEEGGFTHDWSVTAGDSALHQQCHYFFTHSLQSEDLATVLVLIYRMKLITSFHSFVETFSYSLGNNLPLPLTTPL